MRARRHLIVAMAGLCLVAASCTYIDVGTLASNPYGGRNNQTPGASMTRAYLLEQLKPISVGANPAYTGEDAFLQPISLGMNVIAKIPGTDLADEYVIVGAHYDHIGSTCPSNNANDTICNGATDNAAGVAAVLQIGRNIANAPKKPRRTVLLAFWDREEDGLIGSGYYTSNPLVPLAKTVAYINFDIQGANLRPSLRSTTFAVGAESGGPGFAAAVQAAADNTTLDTALFSAPFGQYRSDYYRFLQAGVPSVFYTDSNGPCYHTAQDQTNIVDFAKLGQQIKSASALTRSIIETDTPPVFVAGTPLATFDDASRFLAVLQRALPDLPTFSAADQTALLKILADVQAIVTAGPAQWGPEDVNPTLVAAANAVSILTHGPCDGFLSAPE